MDFTVGDVVRVKERYQGVLYKGGDIGEVISVSEEDFRLIEVRFKTGGHPLSTPSGKVFNEWFVMAHNLDILKRRT